MGEAKRRKQKDPKFGQNTDSPTFNSILQAERDAFTRTISTPEAYEELLKHGLCNPIESVTSSMMGALVAAANNNLETALFCAKSAWEFTSRITSRDERWNWMRDTIQKNTGLDIGTLGDHKLSNIG